MMKSQTQQSLIMRQHTDMKAQIDQVEQGLNTLQVSLGDDFVGGQVNTGGISSRRMEMEEKDKKEKAQLEQMISQLRHKITNLEIKVEDTHKNTQKKIDE